MKAVAKTMVLVLLLAVMGAASLVLVSASEDIPPADEQAAADFSADQEMLNYSERAMAANITVSDATSVYVGNIENSPALRVDAQVAAAEDEEDDEYPDEDAEYYDEPQATNDQPDTGRVSVSLTVVGALLLCGVAPLVRGRK